MGRLKNRLIAKILTRFPALLNIYVKRAKPVVVEGIPWMPFTKNLRRCKIALLTTAGVHLKSQSPFNMNDPDGDPTYREILLNTPNSELMITHDYYDHKDADKDINIVFPIDRLKEMQAAGEIREIAEINYGLMGHVDENYIPALINATAPKIAERLKKNNVDAAILTPG
ncbi:MAG: glycine/sarcosine/betaine reductase selenoprotein B family protein [Nitrospirota bacterium]